VGAKTINGGGPGVAGFTTTAPTLNSFAAEPMACSSVCDASMQQRGLRPGRETVRRIDLNAAAIISPAQTIKPP
jgi:hypothetical protein